MIYAENGHGKTTLAAILRSLSSGDALPIIERQRVPAANPPEVVVQCTGGPQPAMFRNGAWNRTLPDVAIFDDVFIDENIYSGLVVGPEHRQNLHELIIGAQGIALNNALQAAIQEVETQNQELRRLTAAMPTIQERGALGVDAFCDLAERPNIDRELLAAEHNLAASLDQNSIRTANSFNNLTLPEIDLRALQQLLSATFSAIDELTIEKVKAHFLTSGDNAENWIADGVQRQLHRPDALKEECVFCAQSLDNSPIINHYRAYFSQAYEDFRVNIITTKVDFSQAHSGEAVAKFELDIGYLTERHRYWSRFGEFSTITIDLDAVTQDWVAARDSLINCLQQKQSRPLDSVVISEEGLAAVNRYETHRTAIATMNTQLDAFNVQIAQIKLRAAASEVAQIQVELNRLKAVKKRFTPDVVGVCNAYINTKSDKAAAEAARDLARTALEAYRNQVFSAYQAAINRYLMRFNAGFRLDGVTAVNGRTGSSSSYNVVINNTAIAIGRATQPGNHSFRSVLSAGDRNALALSFFLSSLELDPGFSNKVVIIDDPVSSLDEHRSLTTVQLIRGLSAQVRQVIVLSHSKHFLCRIWEHADTNTRSALRVIRDQAGSTIDLWDVDADSETENDRRYALLNEYLINGGGNARDAARSIRPLLESFFRVSYPSDFPAGSLLGPFRALCETRILQGRNLILNGQDTADLRDIVEYANRFHHDTNRAWETEVINDLELAGFIGKAIALARRP